MGIITDKEMTSKAKGVDQWFIDPAPRGAGRFMGRITPSGERSFYFRYTTSTGQRDTLPLGNFDPKGRDGFLTLAAAREKAAGWSKQYKDGGRDLRQHFAKIEASRLQSIEDARQRANKSERALALAEEEAELARQRRLTINQVFDRWAATDLAPHIGGDGKRIGRKDGGLYVREQFERRVFDALGETAIIDVRKADVLAILDAVKAEGKLRTANVLLADLKQMFRFAAEREIIEHSPIELINKRKVGGKDIKRDRTLSNGELTALVRQLPTANLSRRTVLGIWLILATGCRIGELMGSVWIDAKARQQELQGTVDAHNKAQKSGAVHLGFVDLQAHNWYLPTTKNQRDHLIHLSDFAVKQFTELNTLREVDGSTGKPLAWIFPNVRATGPVCIKSIGKQLADRQSSEGARLKNRAKSVDALMLEGGRWTAHDLRRTASTQMSRIGISDDVINECLNHMKQGMSGIYNQDRREAEQVQAFDALGQRLAALNFIKP
jgi:integrase